MLARENRGTFLAVYIARVRVTVHADGATIVREGHGTGEGRGTSPGEVHDIALKAAETDATKRALATFGKPFGLELYRQRQGATVPEASATAAPAGAGGAAARLPPGRHDANSTAVTLLRPAAIPAGQRAASAASAAQMPNAKPAAPPLAPATSESAPWPDRQEPAYARRAQAGFATRRI